MAGSEFWAIAGFIVTFHWAPRTLIAYLEARNELDRGRTAFANSYDPGHVSPDTSGYFDCRRQPDVAIRDRIDTIRQNRLVGRLTFKLRLYGAFAYVADRDCMRPGWVRGQAPDVGPG